MGKVEWLRNWVIDLSTSDCVSFHILQLVSAFSVKNSWMAKFQLLKIKFVATYTENSEVAIKMYLFWHF